MGGWRLVSKCTIGKSYSYIPSIDVQPVQRRNAEEPTQFSLVHS